MTHPTARKLRAAALATTAFAITLPSVAHADVVIGPRVAYYFDNSNLRTSNEQSFEDAATMRDDERTQELRDLLDPFPVGDLTTTEASTAVLADQIGFPMYGGMINFGDDRDRFTITGMYGEGEGDTETVATRQINVFLGAQDVRDLEFSNLAGRSQIERIDVEATWQRRVNENFALTAGVRYERLDIEDAGTLRVISTDQILAVATGSTFVLDNSFPVSSDVVTKSTLETYTARFGATAFVPISDNVNSFFSGMLQAGFSPETELQSRVELLTSRIALPEPQIDEFTDIQSSEISIGPDMAVGLQWLIFDNLALDVRYRAVVFFPLSGEFEFSDAQVNHGVNVGLSLRL